MSNAVLALQLGPAIQLFDLLNEIILGFISLEFEGRGEEIIFLSEGGLSEEELGRVLKLVQGCTLTLFLDLTFEELDHFLMCQNFFVGTSYLIIGGPLFKNRLVRDYNCYEDTLQRITINKDLRYVKGLCYFLLNLVRDHILTLRQFEDVLLSVNNLQAPVWEECSNITCVYPTLGVNGIFSYLGLLVVTLEAAISLVANFASWSR